jgi:hypothetical protein
MDAIWGIAGIVAILITILVGLFLYFIPTLAGHNKQNAGAIFVLNLLAGWTFVGWVVALVWALTVDSKTVVATTAAIPQGPAVLCQNCRKYSGPASKFCTVCGTQIGGTAIELYLRRSLDLLRGRSRNAVTSRDDLRPAV